MRVWPQFGKWGTRRSGHCPGDYPRAPDGIRIAKKHRLVSQKFTLNFLSTVDIQWPVLVFFKNLRYYLRITNIIILKCIYYLLFVFAYFFNGLRFHLLFKDYWNYLWLFNISHLHDNYYFFKIQRDISRITYANLLKCSYKVFCVFVDLFNELWFHLWFESHRKHKFMTQKFKTLPNYMISESLK